jgi:hypothetical protein
MTFTYVCRDIADPESLLSFVAILDEIFSVLSGNAVILWNPPRMILFSFVFASLTT